MQIRYVYYYQEQNQANRRCNGVSLNLSTCDPLHTPIDLTHLPSHIFSCSLVFTRVAAILNSQGVYLWYSPAWGLFLARVQINNPHPAATPERPPPQVDTPSAGADGGSASEMRTWRGARQAARMEACPMFCPYRGSRGTASVCVQWTVGCQPGGSESGTGRRSAGPGPLLGAHPELLPAWGSPESLLLVKHLRAAQLDGQTWKDKCEILDRESYRFWSACKQMCHISEERYIIEQHVTPLQYESIYKNKVRL